MLQDVPTADQSFRRIRTLVLNSGVSASLDGIAFACAFGCAITVKGLTFHLLGTFCHVYIEHLNLLYRVSGRTDCLPRAHSLFHLGVMSLHTFSFTWFSLWAARQSHCKVGYKSMHQVNCNFESKFLKSENK